MHTAATGARQRPPRRAGRRGVTAARPRSSRTSARSRSSSSRSDCVVGVLAAGTTAAGSTAAGPTAAGPPAAGPPADGSAGGGAAAPWSAAGWRAAGTLASGAVPACPGLAPEAAPGSRLSWSNAQSSARSASCSGCTVVVVAAGSSRLAARLLREGLAQLGLLVGGEVGADQLGLLGRELLLHPVDHRVGAEQEQRRGTWRDLVAHGLDERVADADVGQRAEQRAGGRADRQAEDRDEEDQAEQNAPEGSAERP